MDVFIINDTDRPLQINKDNVETATRRMPPNYVIDKEGNRHIYAKCPACKNPIQIIGLYRNQEPTFSREKSRNPYGKHTLSEIPGIGEVDFDTLINCPYRTKIDSKRIKAKLKRNDARVEEFRRFLIGNYDLVLNQLETETGLHISLKNAKEMLEHFVGDSGWNYYNTSIKNFPWTITESDSRRNMFMQLIRKESDLSRALKNEPGVVLKGWNDTYVQVLNEDGKFLRLYYWWHHRDAVENSPGEYSVRTTFSVYWEDKNGDLVNEVYSQTYDCDIERFIKRAHDPTRVKDKSILKIAEDLLL